MTVDILAIGAHPDDVEIGMAGSMLVFARHKMKTAIVDLTRGELGTRGTAEIREREAAQAAERMRLSARENLGLPDGHVRDDDATRMALLQLIRKYRPAVVFTHHSEDISGHPDHHACNQLVRHVCYLSGLAKITSGQERHRPAAIVYFNLARRVFPSFVVDVTDVYPESRKVLASYASQFHNPDSKEPETYLSRANFLPHVEALQRYYGSLIGVEFGEAFWCDRPLQLSNPLAALVPGR
jgi:bacillithiol biosynthesis deacetylase BshB1